MLMVPKRITDESQMLVRVLSRVKGVSVRVLTYCGYSSCEGADDLWNAASRSMQHALGAGLEQQHAGQMEDQGWIFCLLQLLSESLTVHEQGLSKWHTFTKPQNSIQMHYSLDIYSYILVFFLEKKAKKDNLHCHYLSFFLSPFFNMKPHTSAHVSMLVRKSSIVCEAPTVRKLHPCSSS